VTPGSDACVKEFDRARPLRMRSVPGIVKPSGGGGGIGMTIVLMLRAFRCAGVVSGDCVDTFGLPMSIWKNTWITPSHRVSDTGRQPWPRDSPGERNALFSEAPETDRESLHRRSRADEQEMARGREAGNGSAMRSGTVDSYTRRRFYFLEVNARVQVSIR